MSNSDYTTWRKLISEALSKCSLSWADVVFCTLTDAELDVEFDRTWGGPEGKPFTLWTEDRVFFPVEYDGWESVKSAPRNPCDEATRHI